MAGDILSSKSRLTDSRRDMLCQVRIDPPRYLVFIPSLSRSDTNVRVLKRESTPISNPISGSYDTEEKCRR